MKNLFLFLLLLVSVSAYSQKKGKVDPRDAQIDSLMQVTAALTSQLDSTTLSSQVLSHSLDSVSQDREKYYNVYKVMSEKLEQGDFDPADAAAILDSVQSHHINALAALTETSAVLSDSVKVLQEENVKLRESIEKMNNAEADKDQIIIELKQLKGLLDEKIITQEEFNDKKAKLLEKWE